MGPGVVELGWVLPGSGGDVQAVEAGDLEPFFLVLSLPSEFRTCLSGFEPVIFFEPIVGFRTCLSC